LIPRLQNNEADGADAGAGAFTKTMPLT